MNSQERSDLAVSYKQSGFNCCQAVVKAYEDVLGTDSRTLMELSSGFAVGMGCMEATCGSLIGATMVAGRISQGQGTPRIAKALLESFRDKCGATLCKELKGRDTRVVLCPCNDCVKNAVLALEELKQNRFNLLPE